VLELLARLGASVGASAVSFFWIADEPVCPDSLIK